MSERRRRRLEPSIFNLPVAREREGYYSDKYFVRARDVLRFKLDDLRKRGILTEEEFAAEKSKLLDKH